MGGGPDKPNSHNWAAGFAAVRSITVTAVYDHDESTRSAFATAWAPRWGEDVGYFGDYSAMLHAAQPDILCVATRQGLHAAHIERAASAGVKGIIIEKPFATSLAESDRICAACELHGVKLAYGTELRWDRGYMELARLLNEEEIVGTITSITCLGVGDLINHGCHFYDTALMLLGDPEPQWAMVPTAPQPPCTRTHRTHRAHRCGPYHSTVQCTHGLLAARCSIM
jgi:predicted dehydrogenase